MALLKTSNGSSPRCWPRSSPRRSTACRSALLPSVFSLQALPAAGDRLAQPLTYWNGQGALAAIGLVLAAGLAARGHRLAAAAAPVLGLDLYLTLSRGAIGAGLAGLAVLHRAAADQGDAAGDRDRRRGSGARGGGRARVARRAGRRRAPPARARR